MNSDDDYDDDENDDRKEEEEEKQKEAKRRQKQKRCCISERGAQQRKRLWMYDLSSFDSASAPPPPNTKQTTATIKQLTQMIQLCYRCQTSLTEKTHVQLQCGMVCLKCASSNEPCGRGCTCTSLALHLRFETLHVTPLLFRLATQKLSELEEEEDGGVFVSTLKRDFCLPLPSSVASSQAKPPLPLPSNYQTLFFVDYCIRVLTQWVLLQQTAYSSSLVPKIISIKDDLKATHAETRIAREILLTHNEVYEKVKFYLASPPENNNNNNNQSRRPVCILILERPSPNTQTQKNFIK
jgi:hypothetical protein